MTRPTLTGSKFTGVYGKWNYMPGFNAFMGVVHDLTGDVWIYKPDATALDLAFAELNMGIEASAASLMRTFGADGTGTGFHERGFGAFDTALFVPEPATLALLGAGLIGLAVGRARRKQE